MDMSFLLSMKHFLAYVFVLPQELSQSMNQELAVNM